MKDTLNRRLFATGLAGIPLALAAGASAQEASPAASPNASPAATVSAKHPLSSQPGFVRAVIRNFQVTAEASAGVLEGALALLQTSVSEFDTVDNASQALTYLATALPESLRTTQTGATGVETSEVALGDPGEERLGLEVLVTFGEGALFDQLVVVMGLIRKDRWVEILIGGGLEPGWNVIADVGNEVDDRWPSDDAWQMVPTLEEVPAGLEISEEREVLPGQ